MDYTAPKNAREVVDVFYQGFIPWGEVPALLMQFITAENVGSIIDSLPEELRTYFVEEAEASYVDDRPRIVITSGGGMPPQPSRGAVLAVRGWLARHR